MISDTVSKQQYVCTGSALTFSFPHYYFSSSNLKVWRTNNDTSINLLVENTDYTVSSTGLSPSGGNVVFAAPPALGCLLTVARIIPLQQLMTYTVSDNFPALSHEQNLDRLTMICQQLAEAISRCPQAPITDLVALQNNALPTATNRIAKTFTFDGNGNPQAT